MSGCRVRNSTEFLSWVIESKSKDFKPEKCAKWLADRLPQPVSDTEKWRIEED